MQGTGIQKVWRGTQAERFHRICLVTIKVIKHTGVITVYIYRLRVVQQVLSDKSHLAWVSDMGERPGVRGGGWGEVNIIESCNQQIYFEIALKNASLCLTGIRLDGIILCKVRRVLCCNGYLQRCTHSSKISIMCIILGGFVFTVSLTGNCATYTMQPSKYHIKFVFL